MRIFKYLKDYWAAVLLVFALLIVQAVSELALPTYTSDIVDVGISQGGIKDAVPEQLRRESLTMLEFLMSPDEKEIIGRNYAADADGVMQLEPVDDRAILDGIFIGVLSKAAAAQSGVGVDDLGESIVRQIAAGYIKSEYEALGVDMEKLQTDYMISVGVQMLGLVLISVAASILVTMIASYVAAKIGMNLRGKIYAKTLSFSSVEIDKFTTASLITRNTNDIQQIQMAAVMVMRIVLYAPILGVGGIIKVANTRTGMGWVIAVAVGSILVLVGALVAVVMPKFMVMQKLVDKLNLVSREILTGLPVIRAFTREKYEENRFDGANRDLMKTQLFVNRAMSIMMPVMMMVMNCIMLFIVWIGGHRIDAGGMQVGDMMAFITYTMQIVMSFMMLSMISIILPRANVAAGRVDEVLTAEPAIKESAHPVAVGKTDWDGVVKYENVTFRYPDTEEDILRNVSFTAKPGQTTAIIGSTGSGKSTLVSLLPRLYDVTSGKITLDGIDIRDLSLKTLHGAMGFVPQKGVLFSGTIESNIKFGGADISDEAMLHAAEIAQASDFISQKESQYQSPIAQGGTNVSGGQKQRLSIARAIARRPKLLVFDDSFSALDYKTDAKLRRALSQDAGDATVLIVAQRVSTVLHAEQIVVLHEGEVAGCGTHAELLNTCDAYAEIVKSQLNNRELGIEEED